MVSDTGHGLRRKEEETREADSLQCEPGLTTRITAVELDLINGEKSSKMRPIMLNYENLDSNKINNLQKSL